MSCRIVVSLGALARNYRTLCAAVTGPVAAVVKADAYGVGATAVVHRLSEAGCHRFFVATAHEGVALRTSLSIFAEDGLAEETLTEEKPDRVLKPTIYVLEGAREEQLEALVSHQLVPVLNTPLQCDLWSTTGLPCAVHVDTGMQRLGLPVNEALANLTRDDLDVSLLVSHFACADEPDNPFNQKQLETLSELLDTLAERGREVPISLGNSAGIISALSPSYLGRAGIALYGGRALVADDLASSALEPVVRLDAQVLQLRDVQAGVPVGYGGSYVSTTPMRIAILGAGYADGVPRLLSNNGSVYVGDQACPIVGRVSMDLLQVDVSNLTVDPQVPLREGAWVEVIGPRAILAEVADRSQTIDYEVLTGLSPRAPRIYQEAPL